MRRLELREIEARQFTTAWTLFGLAMLLTVFFQWWYLTGACVVIMGLLVCARVKTVRAETLRQQAIRDRLDGL